MIDLFIFRPRYSSVTQSLEMTFWREHFVESRKRVFDQRNGCLTRSSGDAKKTQQRLGNPATKGLDLFVPGSPGGRSETAKNTKNAKDTAGIGYGHEIRSFVFSMCSLRSLRLIWVEGLPVFLRVSAPPRESCLFCGSEAGLEPSAPRDLSSVPSYSLPATRCSLLWLRLRRAGPSVTYALVDFSMKYPD